VSADETADVLDAAADLMWMYGRGVGAPAYRQQRGHTSLCPLEAIAEAEGRPRLRWAADSDTVDAFAERALAQKWPGKQKAVVRVLRWNDNLPNTPENDALVVDTLRRVAKDIRNEADG